MVYKMQQLAAVQTPPADKYLAYTFHGTWPVNLLSVFVSLPLRIFVTSTFDLLRVEAKLFVSMGYSWVPGVMASFGMSGISNRFAFLSMKPNLEMGAETDEGPKISSGFSSA